MADAGFIVYRHDDSVEGYEWAVHHGRRVRQRLEALAEKWDLPELTTYIDGHWTYLREAAFPKPPRGIHRTAREHSTALASRIVVLGLIDFIISSQFGQMTVFFAIYSLYISEY